MAALYTCGRCERFEAGDWCGSVGNEVGAAQADRGHCVLAVCRNRPAFIGEAGGAYTVWPAWRRNPQVVRLGGNRIYSAEEEASFVAEVLARSHAVARQLDEYVGFARSGSEKWRPTYIEQVQRKFEAERTVALIKAHDFDRARLFEVLVTEAPGL